MTYSGSDQKFNRKHAVESVTQILETRARLRKPISHEEADALAKIMTHSNRSSKIGDLRAADLLRRFAGEFTPIGEKRQPSAPRRFSVVDAI